MIPCLQVDKGSTKEEMEDPKTVGGFTDRYTSRQVLLVAIIIMHVTNINTSVYMDALKDHVITNAAGGKTICIKKHNFPDTGCRSLHSL